MGLFKKKKEEPKKSMNSMQNTAQMPSLPELPKLPDFPGMNMEEENDTYSQEPLPQLPSFPNNDLGDKFSQNTIKEAVAGGKRGESGMGADEFSEEEMGEMPESEEDQMMQEYPEEVPRPIRTPMSRSYPNYSRMQYTSEKKVEPVFIRLDKFEESLKIFEEAKDQISEIEHLLTGIKELKVREDEELNSWENKLQEIKRQVGKVDQDIFSKI